MNKILHWALLIILTVLFIISMSTIFVGLYNNLYKSYTADPIWAWLPEHYMFYAFGGVILTIVGLITISSEEEVERREIKLPS